MLFRSAGNGVEFCGTDIIFCQRSRKGRDKHIGHDQDCQYHGRYHQRIGTAVVPPFLKGLDREEQEKNNHCQIVYNAGSVEE